LTWGEKIPTSTPSLIHAKGKMKNLLPPIGSLLKKPPPSRQEKRKSEIAKEKKKASDECGREGTCYR